MRETNDPAVVPTQEADRVLTNTVYTVSPEATVREVVRLMVSRNLGDVVVVDDRKPLGILTDRDIVMRVTAAGLDARATRVKDVMSRPSMTVKRDEDLSVAVALMSRHGIRRLPIVDDDGRLCSILTLDDILLLGLEDCPDLSGIVWQQLRSGQEMPQAAQPAATSSGSTAPTKVDAYLSRRPVTTVARASVIVPMPAWQPPTGLGALRSWYFRNRTWLVIVFLLSLLGAGVALFADYMGRAFYANVEQQSNR